ncbi:MAG: hypothetical protein ACTSUQ_03190 [Candidatus Freyarchaeota archaeon]
MNITFTEEAKRYIAQASEKISKGKEKPALAIWLRESMPEATAE